LDSLGEIRLIYKKVLVFLISLQKIRRIVLGDFSSKNHHMETQLKTPAKGGGEEDQFLQKKVTQKSAK